MALVLKDRVKETTTTTGTGAITLAGASIGYQAFSVIGNANTTYYCIAGQGTTEWEVGIGTYTSVGTTLSRDTILASSNSGSAVTFSAGTKDVFVVYPAGKSVNLDASGNATALGTPASCTVTNFTGTASININGTVGATTPNTGAFTTLSSTGNTTLGDASTDTVTVNGYMGVGGAANASRALSVTPNALTGTNQFGVFSTPTGSTGGTSSVSGLYTAPASAASAYTVNSMRGVTVDTFTKGAGSTITDLHGLYIADQTQGTNNYGITSVVSSGANKYNIYASGTANNYFAGNVGIGATSLTQYNLRVSKTITGNADSVGILVNGLVQSDVTASAVYNQSQIGLAASAFTLTNAYGFFAGQTALSGGAAITSQIGYYAASTLTGATNNYGFRSDIASGTGRWNFYANGTADNYFAGNVGIGVSPSTKLDVSGTSRYTFNVSNAYTLQTSLNAAGSAFADDYKNALSHIWQTSGTERMRIDSSGNLLIGGTTSYGKLTTYVGNNSRFAATTSSGAGGGAGGWQLPAYYGSVKVNYIDCELTDGTGGSEASVMRFATIGSGTLAERMRIDSSGNVGIGTSSPGARLDVKGTLRLSGSTSGYVGLAPAAAAGSTTYTLPSADGSSGQVLSTNGSGTLSWATAGGGFAAGTAMLFAQTAAPTGWTKSTTHNDKALRVVSGAASSGGSVAFTTAFASQGVSGTVGSTTLTTAQIPSHTHTYTAQAGGGINVAGDSGLVNTTSANTGATGGGGSHNHSFTGTAINLAVQYVDVIIATKD